MEQIDFDFDELNKKLNSIEAKLNEIDEVLKDVMDEIGIGEDKNTPSNQTSTYDGEIVFEYKPKDNNDKDESYIYDINRSI